MDTIGNVWLWAGFALFVVAALALDMIVLKKEGAHRVGMREALVWSAVWVAVSLVFAGSLWWWMTGCFGAPIADERALEFLTGYLIEKSLAIDNIFVFLTIFTYFSVPAEFQKRALVIGIVAAIVLRAALIFAGAWLIAEFDWVLYVFGVFLLVTGINMWWSAGKASTLDDNPILRVLRRIVRVSPDYDGEKLMTVRNGTRIATPLLLVVLLIGISDVVFAVDSIPAIFAITTDPFIVLTSNIFAVLGLRAMYFLLAGMAERFHLLPYGLAVVLVFVGGKMLLADVFHVSPLASLAVVMTILIATVVLSMLRPVSAAAPNQATAKRPTQ